jgi:hypothetical protein
MKCARYHGDTTEPGFQCDAFPKGIPDAIIFGDTDHRKPYPGDHGIRFEPIKPPPAQP